MLSHDVGRLPQEVIIGVKAVSGLEVTLLGWVVRGEDVWCWRWGVIRLLGCWQLLLLAFVVIIYFSCSLLHCTFLFCIFPFVCAWFHHWRLKQNHKTPLDGSRQEKWNQSSLERPKGRSLHGSIFKLISKQGRGLNTNFPQFYNPNPGHPISLKYYRSKIQK